MNKILISSRAFKKNYKNSNDRIKQVLTYNPEGVQISFLNVKELLDYKPTKEVIDLLKNKYNVFHAPTKNIIYKDEEKSNKVLKKIKELYNKLNCKIVVFHYNNFKDPSYVADKLLGLNLCIENLDLRRAEENYIEKMKMFFENYPNFSLCLDVCHVLEHSKKDLFELIRLFKNKIKLTHWSYTFGELKHYSAKATIELAKSKKVEKELNELKETIKDLNQPIVLEINRRHVFNNFGLISKEMEYLKE